MSVTNALAYDGMELITTYFTRFEVTANKKHKVSTTDVKSFIGQAPRSKHFALINGLTK